MAEYKGKRVSPSPSQDVQAPEHFCAAFAFPVAFP